MEGGRQSVEESGKPRRNLPRILCVDDDASVLKGLGRQLRSEFEVVTATDPEQALRMLRNNETFSVVLSDLRMPQMHGVEFLEQVREILPHATRVVLSAYVQSEMREGAEEEVFSVLSKPCPPQVLRDGLADAVEHHERVRERALRSSAPPLGIEPGDTDVQIRSLSSVPGECAPPRPRIAPVMPGVQLRIGVWLNDNLVELAPGTTLVGRSRSCHLWIADPLISRRHVSFTNTAGEVIATNLSATNPARLNGTPLTQPRPVHVGDHVEVGLNDLEIRSMGEYYPSIEPTVRLIMDRFVAERPQCAKNLSTVASVARKCFALGHGREAAHMLEPVLSTLLESAREGKQLASGDRELALELSASLAEATHSGAWIDYVFELSTALLQPLPSAMVDRLYQLLPTISGATVACLRAHVAALQACKHKLTAGQRFALRRTEGLEPMLMVSAHR